ncbi:hypothetical protein OEZ85_004615 [Tetradesmus obliquus]|uniref:Expansin-like EG45 domain-containing protein n=1 Tax=Tetradesmus obliquus TaxID=3088 RepID=A0ABY8UL98_TETOB|nr:hypothetical protein OEZ85_004615 [Tetradesmus obliquus]
MSAHQSSAAFLVVASCLLAALAPTANAGDYDGWSQGRATFYGGSDGMSIHQGSCMFGNIDGNKGTGWDIAAISDKASDYAGSCGRCYEVACRPTHIRDGYGSSMDRTHSCNGQSSVIVTVTDTCPCYYPSNAYSNKRW